LVFGGVLAQLQTHDGYAPSPKPCHKPKILASQRYIFSVNALGRTSHIFWQPDGWRKPLLQHCNINVNNVILVVQIKNCFSTINKNNP
jgi:hypothetical protein